MSRTALKRLLIGIIFLGLGLGAAIISWSIRTKPCRDFRLQVEALYRSLPKDRLRTAEEQEETNRLLQRACQGELQRCNFRICSEIKTTAVLTSPLPTAFEERAPSFRPDSEAEIATTTTSTLLYPPALQWLEHELSCSDFLQEINVRYPAISRFAELTPEKQNELKVVLRIACSARFKECQFSACRVTNPPEKQ